jgi:ABC-type antimicrobial peptide transport system permease subunit
MGFMGAILGVLGGISGILFIVENLRPEAPLIKTIPELFPGSFWMYLAGLLFLGAIVCLLGRKHNTID